MLLVGWLVGWLGWAGLVGDVSISSLKICYCYVLEGRFSTYATAKNGSLLQLLACCFAEQVGGGSAGSGRVVPRWCPCSVPVLRASGRGASQ